MISILLVDDDEDILEMVQTVLTVHGYAVTTVNNGSAVFDAVEKSQAQLIIMDIFLGDRDGRDVCLSLKQNETSKNVPVILYSAGFISSSSVQLAMADDFMSKPFDIHHLLKKIKTLV